MRNTALYITMMCMLLSCPLGRESFSDVVATNTLSPESILCTQVEEFNLIEEVLVFFPAHIREEINSNFKKFLSEFIELSNLKPDVLLDSNFSIRLEIAELKPQVGEDFLFSSHALIFDVYYKNSYLGSFTYCTFPMKFNFLTPYKKTIDKEYDGFVFVGKTIKLIAIAGESEFLLSDDGYPVSMGEEDYSLSNYVNVSCCYGVSLDFVSSMQVAKAGMEFDFKKVRNVEFNHLAIPDDIITDKAGNYKWLIIRGLKENVFMVRNVKDGSLRVIKMSPSASSDRERKKNLVILEHEYWTIKEMLDEEEISSLNCIPKVGKRDFDKRRNCQYFDMEFVPQLTLYQVIYYQNMSLKKSVETAISIAKILSVIHKKGYIHFDIKPQNIIVGENSVVFIDFGAARSQLETTLPLIRLGTPLYTACETYFLGCQIDNRSDLFSLGVTIYEMLFSELLYKYPFPSMRGDPNGYLNFMKNNPAFLPFQFDEGVLKQKMMDRFGIDSPGLLDVLFEFLTKALQNNPDRRFQDADEMIFSLQNILRMLPFDEEPCSDFRLDEIDIIESAV